ncbi:MAG: T9SS type A sorting domain-containing protein [Bacteroidetes bacterium]|nr:T9SS type A sorting domain-containing protein [Bacteroidota bacterium]HET6245882.1 T9SS type A sorting domain-containing protein [Bacteroidia bacterium]
MTPAHYSASYWYWGYNLPSNAPSGSWRFEVVFQGQTFTHEFQVQAPVGIHKYKVTNNKYSVYPNPSNGLINVAGDIPVKKIELLNLLGEVVFAEDVVNMPSINFSKKNAKSKGVYFLAIYSEDNSTEIHKIILE